MTQRKRVTGEFDAVSARSSDKLSTLARPDGRSVGPYRDPRDSLIARRRGLEADLRLAERVEARAERVRSYLPVLDAELREATEPFLDAVRVKTPCRERWEAMEGGAAVRHCARCARDVYDLSKMTRDEIAMLFASETPCVRLRRRPDGRVVTADCPTDVRSRGLRAAALAALVGGGLYAAGTLTTLGGAEPPSTSGAAAAPSVVAKEALVTPIDPTAMFEPDEVQPEPHPTAPEEGHQEIHRTGPSTWEVDRSLVERALHRPEHHPVNRIVPHVEDGRTLGVRVYGIRRSSTLYALGIRNGDLLLEVNGVPMTSPDHALEVYSRLRVTDSLFVRLVRRGEKRMHAYRIVD